MIVMMALMCTFWLSLFIFSSFLLLCNTYSNPSSSYTHLFLLYSYKNIKSDNIASGLLCHLHFSFLLYIYFSLVLTLCSCMKGKLRKGLV